MGRPSKGHLSTELIKAVIKVLVAYLCLCTKITRMGGQSLSSRRTMKVASMYLTFASQMRALTLNLSRESNLDSGSRWLGCEDPAGCDELAAPRAEGKLE
jgi:hypothetical protein